MTAVDVRSQFEETITVFKSASVDCQLTVLWQAYDTLGQAFASVAPVALFSQAVQQLVKQLNQVNREDQLEILRDILSGADTRFTQVYQTLSVNMKLAFWQRLFSHRDWQHLLSVTNCQPASQTLIARLSTMGLNERLHFLRRVVA
jgi:hypothetical protein